MEGWKTYTAGVLTILGGLVGLYFHFKDPTSPLAMPVEAAWALVTTGLGILGIGHKLDKQTAEMKKQTDELKK